MRPFRRPRVRTALTCAVVFVGALVLATSVHAYAVQAFFITSGSMSPTLQVGDHILVDKLASQLNRGDIVVFRRPPAAVTTDADLVKRVVGLPGQTISSRGATIFVDGKPITQPWLPALEGNCARTTVGIPPTRIPAGRYFVMGDCRGDSYDSRSWGTLPASDVVGKVVAVVWRHPHPWFHWF